MAESWKAPKSGLRHSRKDNLGSVGPSGGSSVKFKEAGREEPATEGGTEGPIFELSTYWDTLDRAKTSETLRSQEPSYIEKAEYERREAEHFRFDRKIKPGSQYGRGKRKPYAPPPWEINSSVLELLANVQQGFVPAVQEKAASQKLTRSIKGAVADDHEEPPCFCRLQNFQLVKESPLLNGMAKEDMPVHNEVPTVISICEMGVSDSTLASAIGQTGVDVVMGLGVKVNVSELVRSLPKLRSLGLSLNQLNNDMDEIADWIKGNSRLERLSISQNNVDNAGALSIAKGLAANTRLTSLKLSEGRIKDDGAAAIAEAILSCPCVSIVEVAIQEEQVDLLEIALAHNFPFSSDVLHKASVYGSAKSIKYLCDAFPDIADKPNAKGWTPLMQAVVEGQMGSIAMFTKLKCDIEKRDKQERTLIHLASLHGQNHALRFLLTPWRSKPPKLHKPVKLHFELEAVKSLWDPENIENESMRLMHEKKESTSFSMMKRASLVSGISSQNDEKDRSATPPLELTFELSCLGQSHESAHVLVPQQAASTNLHLRLPFQAMVYGEDAFIEIKVRRWDIEGNPSTLGFAQISLSLLLEKHPEVSPQWLQILGGNMRPVGWLKISGRAVFHQLERDCLFGTTALLDAASKGHLEVCETLVANGANIDATDADGNTPLLNAVWGGHRHVVLMLLRERSNIHHENRNGVTALTAAERREHYHIVPILQSHLRVARGQPMNIQSWDMEPTPPGTPDKEGNPDDDTTSAGDKTEVTLDTNKDADRDRDGTAKNKVRWREKGKGQLDWLESMFRGEFLDSRLDIEVVAAVDLPRADVLGLSDPYCVLNLNGSVFKTSVRKNTLTPVWEDAHVFNDQRRGVWAEQALVLEVYDWNRIGKEKLLGRLEMEVLDLEFLQEPDTGGEEWFFLHDENGNQVYGEPPEVVKQEVQRQQKEEKKKKGRRGSTDDDSSDASKKSGRKGKRASLVPLEKGQPSQVLLKFRFHEGAGKYCFLHISRGVSFDLDAKGKAPNLVAWVKSTGAHISSKVCQKTTSPVWGWDVRIPARTNDVNIRIEVRKQHEQDATLPGALVGMIDITTGQVEVMVGGGLTQGWVELESDQGGRVRNQEGAAIMILMRMKVWTKTTDTHEEDERTLHGPPPEPRLQTRMPDAVWAQMQALKHTCEPVGWARAAWERFGTEVIPDEDDSLASIDTVPEYCLTRDGVRDLLRELGHELSPDDVLDIVEQYANMEGGEGAPRVMSWPDLCELLGFDRETPLEGEPIPEQRTKEIVVNGHCKAKIGQRVVLRDVTKEKFPDMLVDSGDGPGTIVFLDHAMDGDHEASHGRTHIEGLTVRVKWDKTNRVFDYRTGYEGHFRLCIHQPESKIKVEDLDFFITKHRATYLKNLDLSFNHIGNPGVTALASSLSNNPTLQSLSLYSNIISRPGGDELGKLLSQNRSLTDLQLGSNRLQDEGLFHICSALRAPDAVLKVLGVDSNEITSKGARLFAKCFFEAPSLEILKLGDNALGGDGAQILGEGLRYCRKLHRLELQSNALGTRGIQLFSIGMKLRPARGGKPAVSGNTTLVHLDLRANNILDAGVEEFSDAINRHKKLEVADFADNPISEEAQKLLKETIHEKNLQLNLEKYATVLEKVWRGALARRVRAGSTKVTGGTLAWNTLRKHIVEEEQEKPFGLRATGMSPELWAKTVFLREAIPGQGLTITGLQKVIKELGKNASTEACANLMAKFTKSQDATMMPWWAFCRMMQIDPGVLESHAESAKEHAIAEEEEERLSRERDEMFVDPEDREDADGHKASKLSEEEEEREEGEQVPVLYMGWGEEGEDEPQRVALLAEAQAIMRNIKTLNATGFRERVKHGDDSALEEMLMMEARADEIIQEAELAHLRAVEAHDDEMMEASQLPEDLRKAGALQIADFATDKATQALDKYEQLEKLLARRDADPEDINRLVAELEEAQSKAVEELSVAEVKANVDKLRESVHESEARAEQRMLEASLGLEAEAAGMDGLSKAYHQLQEVLQKHGGETEEDIDEIEEAWEAFEIAQQDAEDAIALAEEEGALLASQASGHEERSPRTKTKKQVRREVSWEDSINLQQDSFQTVSSGATPNLNAQTDPPPVRGIHL